MKKAVVNTLVENGISSAVEVSLAVVGDRKMRALNNKYRKLDKTTNVLSFPLHETANNPEFISGSPRNKEDMLKHPSADGQHDSTKRLGDIVISYPQVLFEAARDEVLVDEKIDELIKHSMLHLLGIHHE
jgi:probable rRNA maturation factor